MLTKTAKEAWEEFILLVKEGASAAEFQNWIAPIKPSLDDAGDLTLQVPNIFVQEYLLQNFRHLLGQCFPTKPDGSLALNFSITPLKKEEQTFKKPSAPSPSNASSKYTCSLNSLYTFEDFIEGPANQFVKSASYGVASRPGRSYNPLFIHGGVGLGKTHLLHAIGHMVRAKHRNLKVHCITTEAFINDLVDHLRNKSIDKMKRFYRSLDVLLIDDIQFLQNRINFEEEFCATFEALINQSKQIVVACDKPPTELKLSERMIARMEWGLVANIGVPDLETRVAILQHKAQKKGINLPHKVAFFIAERIFQNVRQLEGALNRLAAYSTMMGQGVSEEIVEATLGSLFQKPPSGRISVDTILKRVASMFEVKVSDLCGNSRTKHIAFPRQVAMYLAKEMVNDSVKKLASAFGGKTHSTLLHAWKKVSSQIASDEALRCQIERTRRDLERPS